MSKRKPQPKKPAKAKAPAKPKAAKKPPSERPPMIKVDRLEWEHHLECQQLAAEIAADQATFAEMKKAAMDVKSSISGKLVKLRRMLQNGPERLPLFDGPKAAPPQPVKAKGGKTAKGAKTKAVDATAQTAAPAVDPEAWRSAPLQASLHKPGERALTTGINALLKAGVTTIGQLVDRQSKGFGWTDSIPGFGEAAVTALENALTDYLTRTRDKGVFAEAAAQALKRADDNAANAEPAKAQKFPDDGNGKSIAETQAASKKADGAKPKKSERPRKAKQSKSAARRPNGLVAR